MRRHISGLGLALLLLAGCGGGASGPGPSEGEQVPVFLILDHNVTSDLYDTIVSPRDFITQVSGWYFGLAT